MPLVFADSWSHNAQHAIACSSNPIDKPNNNNNNNNDDDGDNKNSNNSNNSDDKNLLEYLRTHRININQRQVNANNAAQLRRPFDADAATSSPARKKLRHVIASESDVN